MQSSVVVELVVFKLKNGVDQGAFSKAVENSNVYLKKCPGFLDRQLSKAEDGVHWADVLHWKDMSNAKKAAEGIMAARECEGFLKMLDEKSIQMWHLTPVMTV